MSWIGRIFRGDEGAADRGLSLPGDGDRFYPAGARTAFRLARTRAATDPATGRRIFRSGVGVSFESEKEAEELAEAQAELALQAALSASRGDPGSYAYFANRKTEPLVETLGDAARITINGYGALVLNAARVLFVDIDATDDGEEPPASQLPESIAAGLAHDPTAVFRTYRTRSGWRLLCVNRVFDPASGDVQSLLQDFRADPKYATLCRVQRSFRARLTPKPWRANYRRQEIVPGSDVGRAEVQRYIDKTWRFATARLLEGASPQDALPEVWPIVEYHDRWTQATSQKPLA